MFVMKIRGGPTRWSPTPIAHELGAVSEGEPLPALALEAYDILFSDGSVPRSARRVRASAGEMGAEFIAVNWEGGPDAHGRRLHGYPREPVLARQDLLLAECVLWGVQDRLSELVATSVGRRWTEARGFLRESGVKAGKPNDGDALADFGLRKGRLDAAIALMRAVLAADGRFREVPAGARVNLDLVRPKRVDGDPLLRAFAKTEYSLEVDDDLLSRIREGFTMLEDAGLMPLSPSDLVCVRFRSTQRKGCNGLYCPGFRDIVVRPSSPGSFVHELGHALDHMLGRPSGGPGFSRIRRLYVSALGESYGPYDGNYLRRPEEVFARTFEIYARSRVGPGCPLLGCRVGEPGYPDSPELLDAATGYFDGVLARLGREPGCRFPERHVPRPPS